MRSHTDPQPRPPIELTERARRSIAGAALLLLAGAFFTGGATSPLLLPLTAALILLVRYSLHPIALLAPFLAGFLIAMVETLMGDGALRGALGGLVVVASATPGWIWRREARAAAERLARLDDILAQARRGRTAEAPAAARELTDLELALVGLAEQIGARAAMVWDVESYRGIARVRAASTRRPGPSVRLSGDPLGWVWDQGMRLRLDPSPRWADEQTIIVADRLRRGEHDGLLVTYAFDGANLPVDDATFVQSAVYLRGVLALQEARSTAAAGKRRVESLVGYLDSVHGDLEISAAAASLCAAAMAITDATGATLGTWNGESGTVIGAAGADGGPVAGDEFVAPASELALAIRANAMITRDAAGWSLGRTALASPEERWIHRPRSMAALPLTNAGEVYGVLAVWSAHASELDPDALDLLRLLAPQAILHIEHAREFGRISESAERDPLTQLRNRRGFDRVFADEAVRFARHGRSCSLLVLDLDHFKSVNDQYGHEAGDEVLCRTARILDASIRDIDTAARFGGEEFVVLLPETAVAAALEVAERIRSAVAESDIEFRGHRIPVRVSIGVSACPDRVPVPSDLITSADAALYRAKAEGRNRVVAASA